MLLLIEDMRLWEPVTLERSLTQPHLRPRVARLLGRLGDPRGERYLVDLVDDPEAETALVAAEALASLVSEDAVSSTGRAALRRVVANGPDADAHLAVTALQALGADLAELEDLVETRDPAARLSRLVPALVETPPVAWVEVVRPFFAQLAVRERRALAQAFARGGTGSEDWAVELLSDPDDWVQSAGWRARGRIAERPGCQELLERALQPLASANVWAAALAAVESCFARGVVAASVSRQERVAELLRHDDTRVRLAAIRLARFFVFSEPVAGQLTTLARRETAGLKERREAIVSLARAGDRRAADLVTELQRSRREEVRRMVASVLDQMDPSGLDALFFGDAAPSVRSAAVTTIARRGPRSKVPWTLLLQDSSADVRTATLLSLVRRPELTLEELLESIGGSERADREPRVRLALVEALVARARRQRMERGGILLMLGNVARDDPSPVVRRLAARRLLEAGEERVAWRPSTSRRSETYYEGLLDLAGFGLELTWTTERGDFVLGFDCRHLALLCRNLEQLAGQGFYRATTIGDSEVGRRVALGDPTDSGVGGPGYFVRDASDAALSRLDAGLVWWDRRWPDAGGSRLVVGLAPLSSPAVEGLPIGRVVSGAETLSVLQSGDRVLDVRARRIPSASD